MRFFTIFSAHRPRDRRYRLSFLIYLTRGLLALITHLLIGHFLSSVAVGVCIYLMCFDDVLKIYSCVLFCKAAVFSDRKYS